MTDRRLVSFKDVQLAYLTEGISAVESMVAEGTVSKDTLRRALRRFHEQGRADDEFERFVAERAGPIGRGRTPPAVGETRSYKVQQIKGTGPFLRIPVDSLDVAKGGVVRVRFEDERILLSK